MIYKISLLIIYIMNYFFKFLIKKIERNNKEIIHIYIISFMYFVWYDIKDAKKFTFYNIYGIQ